MWTASYRNSIGKQAKHRKVRDVIQLEALETFPVDGISASRNLDKPHMVLQQQPPVRLWTRFCSP